MHPVLPESTPARGASRWPHVRRRIVGPLVIIVAALLTMLRLLEYGMVSVSHIDLSFPEGAVTARALDVAAGDSPYSDWREWPHGFAPYGPLTYYPVGWAARMFRGDDGAPSGRSVYLLGRAQSFLSLAGIILLLFILTRTAGGSIASGFLASCLFLSWEWLMAFLVSYRPDAATTFFSVLAVAMALSGPAKGWRLAGALAALYVAMWFKPVSWATLAVLLVWIARHRGARSAGILGGLFGLAGLLPALALNGIMDGRLFHNMLGSMDNGVDLLRPAEIFGLIPHPFQLLLVCGVVIALCEWKARMKSGEGLLDLALMLSVIVAALQTLKAGSHTNYYVEAHVFSVLVVVRKLVFWWREEGGTARAALTREVILAAAVVLLAAFPLRDAALSFPRTWKMFGYTRTPPPIAARLARLQGPVLCENPFLALTHPQAPGILDYKHYQIMVERGKVDKEQLLDRLRRREFVAVEVSVSSLRNPETPQSAENQPRMYCPEFWTVLFEHYIIRERYGAFVLYFPR